MASCSGDVPGKAAAPTTVDVVPASGATGFLELSADDYGRHSTGDLYELVWGEGRGGGGVAVAAFSPPAPPHTPDVQLQALPAVSPSEHEMAAWLHTIVTGGQEQWYGAAVADDDGGGGGVAAGLVAVAEDDGAVIVPAEEPNRQLTTKEKREKLPETETHFYGTDTTRKSTARVARRANYAESHSQTEKRRRSKINQRLKILQQLVPGCSETNQVSTLEQTIRYVKSLQQQVQAMAPSVGGGYYGMMRPVVCSTTGATAVPPPVPVAAFAPGRGCVPGQGLFLGAVRLGFYGPPTIGLH